MHYDVLFSVCSSSDDTATDSSEESDYESEGGSSVEEEVLDVEEGGLESLVAGQSLEEVIMLESYLCTTVLCGATLDGV